MRALLDGVDVISAGTPVEESRLAAPYVPGAKIVCHAVNYPSHAGEVGIGSKPYFFYKPPTSVIGPGDQIQPHAEMSDQLDFETELAVVIGVEARDVPIGDAYNVVAGYTVINDVSHRSLQFSAHAPDVRARYGMNWTQGKGLDASCAIGPWITITDELNEPYPLRLRTWVDGAAPGRVDHVDDLQGAGADRRGHARDDLPARRPNRDGDAGGHGAGLGRHLAASRKHHPLRDREAGLAREYRRSYITMGTPTAWRGRDLGWQARSQCAPQASSHSRSHPVEFAMPPSSLQTEKRKIRIDGERLCAGSSVSVHARVSGSHNRAAPAVVAAAVLRVVAYSKRKLSRVPTERAANGPDRQRLPGTGSRRPRRGCAPRG